MSIAIAHYVLYSPLIGKFWEVDAQDPIEILLQTTRECAYLLIVYLRLAIQLLDGLHFGGGLLHDYRTRHLPEQVFANDELLQGRCRVHLRVV